MDGSKMYSRFVQSSSNTSSSLAERQKSSTRPSDLVSHHTRPRVTGSDYSVRARTDVLSQNRENTSLFNRDDRKTTLFDRDSRSNVDSTFGQAEFQRGSSAGLLSDMRTKAGIGTDNKNSRYKRANIDDTHDQKASRYEA